MPTPEHVAGRPDLRLAYSVEGAAALTRLFRDQRAEQSGAPTRVSLRAVIIGLNVIGPSRDLGYAGWRPDGRSG
jgi:hypothetical protein